MTTPVTVETQIAAGNVMSEPKPCEPARALGVRFDPASAISFAVPKHLAHNSMVRVSAF